MSAFRAKRVTREYVHKVSAPPATVFPLLCPVREHDWIDGWRCTLIHTDSGVAENNCVFTTDFPRGGEEIWVVSRYDPEGYMIQFVVVRPEMYVMKIDICLSRSGDDSSNVRWSNVFTGLTPEGNTFIAEHCEAASGERMDLLFKVLDHYVTTGTMLKKDALTVSLRSALHGS